MRGTSAGLIACLAVGILGTPDGGEAQVPTKGRRIGVLCPWVCPSPRGERLSPPISEKNPDDLMADEAFRLGLRDLGWTEGENLTIEWRSAQGQYGQLPVLALMTYGPDTNQMFRRAAAFVDKIPRGAKPGELPMEQPMRFEMVVNLATARALGLVIPPSILIRADRLIR